MPEYSLSLRLDTESLVTARRLGQKIVVAKSPGEASAQVVWVAFDPFRTNEVTWASGYTLCARRGLSDVVETLTPESPTPSGAAYKLDGSGFQRTDEKLFPPKGTYRVFNELDPSPPDLEFGLVQAVSWNGTVSKERIVAQVIPVHQFADFTPVETVTVWLQSNVSVGDTVTIPPPVGTSLFAGSDTVSSLSTEIRFGGDIAGAVYEDDMAPVYEYDPSAGGFVRMSQR